MCGECVGKIVADPPPWLGDFEERVRYATVSLVKTLVILNLLTVNNSNSLCFIFVCIDCFVVLHCVVRATALIL